MLWKTTALIVTLAIAPNAAAQVVTPPAVPANLEVPDGNIPYLIARADGTQNYVCVPTSSGHTWTFFGPQATLFGDGGQQVTTHFLSPNPAEGGTPRATWQHSGDTSTVWAAAIANSTDSSFVAPGAIPWLLLRVVGSEEGLGGRDADGDNNVHPAGEHGWRDRPRHRMQVGERYWQEGARALHDRLCLLPLESAPPQCRS